MPGPLQNVKHERFCREYASGETLATAYVRAGYKDSNNARYNGSRLRNTPACRARINELMEQFADQSAVKVEYVQSQILPVLQTNAQDLFDASGQLRPLAELQRDCAAAIKSIKFDKSTGKVSEIVLADKIAAAGVLLRSIIGPDTINNTVNLDLGRRLDEAIQRTRTLRRTPSSQPHPEQTVDPQPMRVADCGSASRKIVEV